MILIDDENNVKTFIMRLQTCDQKNHGVQLLSWYKLNIQCSVFYFKFHYMILKLSTQETFPPHLSRFE